MSDFDAARHEAKEEHRLRGELARAHAALAVESAERSARTDELYRQSREDAFTGLPNRPDFTERMREECRCAERFRQPLCVAMVDVDHFKRVNDKYGHAADEQALVEIARRLRGALRPGAIWWRNWMAKSSLCCCPMRPLLMLRRNASGYAKPSLQRR